MINSMISLSFTLYSNKGAYALLLGSGISCASGIPTGREVVLDLIRKVAKLEAADCEPDPAEWFRRQHGSEPDYSKLLDALAKTPTERQQILRGYFEPTEAERSQGLKLPNAAHKAIAQLAAAGYLRVILTINFDRLIEKALEDTGVIPTVISTADQLAGALPLTHSSVTVIKLHGDYLDTRIKNTQQELATYDESLNRLLDRILDEYGLIVSGWSSDLDTALRVAMERCPSRRFTTFWTTQSPLSEKAQSLTELRRAVVIQIQDADHFFEAMRAKVQALEDMASTTHPLSAKMAVATVKRYLADPSAKIRFRDLVHQETEKLFAAMSGPAFAAETQRQPAEDISKRVDTYGAFCEVLLSIIVTGCYWDNDGAVKLWVDCLQRIANPERGGGSVQLRRYPVLLLLYGAGVASIAAQKYRTLAHILTKPKAKDYSGGKYEPLCREVHTDMMECAFGQTLGKTTTQAPVSKYLYEKLREPLREYLPRDEDYQEAFDRFEYLFGLVYADLTRRPWHVGWRGPIGCFIWRHGSSNQTSKKIDVELEAEGANWPLLKAGLLGGSLEQAKIAKEKFDQFLSYSS